METWLPLATLVGGYVGRVFSEWFQDRRLTSRGRDARDAAKHEQLEERRANFQRQTLLDLQEALHQLARATVAAHHQDLMAYRSTGHWQKQLLDERSEKLREAQARTTILIVRVQDNLVRELAEKFKHDADNVLMCDSPSGSSAALGSMMQTFDTCNSRIGELLRELDGQPPSISGPKPK